LIARTKAASSGFWQEQVTTMLMRCLLGLVVPVSAGIIRLPVKRMARESEPGRDPVDASFEAVQSLASAALALGSGSQELFLGNEQNNAYFAEVLIGTPGQPLQLILDTGSANLWVPAEKRNPKWNGRHNFYHPNKSSTYVQMDKRFSIEYGSGDVSGSYFQDTVAVGGLVLPNFTLAHVRRTAGLHGFRHASYDGILGLAFQENAVDNVSTVMKELVLSEQLDEPVFGFYLGDRQPGQFVIGGVDPEHFVGDFHFVEVSSTSPWPGFWALDLAGVKVGDALTLTATHHAIVDSGTSLISGPSREVKAIAAMLGAFPTNGLYAIKCNVSRRVAFSFGGKDLEFEVEDLVIEREGNLCLLGLEPYDFPAWFLGDVFMRKFYVQFDWGQKRMGFAAAASTKNLV